MNEQVDVMIAQMNGATDPPPIAITFKQGARTVLRVEITPSDFALALTGRLVIGTVTRGAGVVVGHAGERS